MAPVPPRDPRYGYWYRANRPYTGCGCLYAVLLVLLIWALLSWLFAWPTWWGWWYY